MEKLRIPLRLGSNPENNRPNQDSWITDERVRMGLYEKPFELPRIVRESLSNQQRELLNELTRASRRIADLYAAQEAISFWPEKITEEEIRHASQENPDVMSPYTYVRRDDSGNIVTRPIHEVFGQLIREKGIAESLKHAARLAGKGKTRDLLLQAFLRERARAFDKGNWEASESLWLRFPEQPKIFIVIGPYDNYLDPNKIKFAWQSWVGVLDEEETHLYSNAVQKFLKWWEDDTKRIPPKVDVRVDHTVLISGQAAKYDWTGNSLPCQMDLRQEFGSVFTIFEPVFEDRFKEKILPTFKTIIHPSKRSGVAVDVIRDVNKRRHVYHETAHSLISSDIRNRLVGSSAWIKELFCDLTALKGIFALSKSTREKEMAFATAFVNGSLEYMNYINNTSRPEYYIASSILLNYCIQEGSIQIKNKRIFWENSQEVINQILKLCQTVEEIERSGTRSDSHNLHSLLFKYDIFEPLKPLPKSPTTLFN